MRHLDWNHTPVYHKKETPSICQNIDQTSVWRSTPYSKYNLPAVFSLLDCDWSMTRSAIWLAEAYVAMVNPLDAQVKKLTFVVANWTIAVICTVSPGLWSMSSLASNSPLSKMRRPSICSGYPRLGKGTLVRHGQVLFKNRLRIKVLLTDLLASTD